jgi:hypothetical protein
VTKEKRMGNQEYIPQIRIGYNDPVNSVKGLEGSVIGILFERTGEEIHNAINSRFKLIDQKISEYESMCSMTVGFIETKKKNIKELDEFLREKKDEKEAFLIPVRKKIEKIVKESNDIIYQMDLETFNMMKKKALIFEEGFDKIKKEFDGLSDLLEKDKTILFGSKGILRHKDGYKEGATGVQGVTGEIGIQGDTGPEGWPREPVRGIGFGGSVGVGFTNPDSKLELSTDPETRAYARLNTLRGLLRKNTEKLELLKDAIVALKEEKRRLQLTYDNIDKNREYKLDLNMLSAFGFEDI